MVQLISNIIRSKPGSVSIVAFLLLIPLALIESKIRERADFHIEAVNEISNSWTRAQTVLGPVLVVEYETSEVKSTWSEKEGRYMTNTVYLDKTAMLPMETLSLKSSIGTQERYRGIHEVQVYTSQIELAGSYEPGGFEDVLAEENFHRVMNIYLWISVSDQRGFVDIPSLSWGDEQYRFAPGGHKFLDQRGIKVDLQYTDVEQATSFATQFGLRGTHVLNFVPTGKTTGLNMTSPWPHPKFAGMYLPTSRTVDNGFIANWEITELATNIGRDLAVCAAGTCTQLLANNLGVELIEPVDLYLISERAVKYGLLFVGLVFALVIAGEITRSVEVHPIQYLMVGVGLSIFYLLLIALSEHIAFHLAYIVAALMCSSLLTYYGIHIFADRTIGLGFGGVIAGLFSLLYVVLNAEDIALLLGTLITFLVVTILMVVTRNIEQLEVFASGLWGETKAVHSSG